MKTITLDMLYALGACQLQVDLFARTFGQQVDVTPDVCVEHASLFEWDWGARNLLPATLYAEYLRQCAPLLAEYERQCAPLYAEYRRQCAPLLAEYERQRDTLWAECKRQLTTLRAEYERQLATLLAKCRRQCARVFCPLFVSAEENLT